MGNQNRSGSRFEALGDLVEPVTQEVSIETKANVDSVNRPQVHGTDMDPKAKGKAKLTLDDGSKRNDNVTLSVSHMDITKNLKESYKSGVTERIRVVGPQEEPKKTEKKPLKDISNRLEAQPVITKANQTGL